MSPTPESDQVCDGFIPAGADSIAQIINKSQIKEPVLVKNQLGSLGIESLHPSRPLKSRTGTGPGYPLRQHVNENDASWSKHLTNYRPPDYTAAVVLDHETEWADPKNVRDVKRKFLTRTKDGETRVALDDDGKPLNPLGRTGLGGRGLLGKWGRNQSGDALLTRVDPDRGRLQVLLIERNDSGQLALPGGMVDKGEDIAATVARELREETAAKLDFKGAKVLFSGVVDDPRNTDNAWLETTVLHLHLMPAEHDKLALQAGDDARQVRWFDVDWNLVNSMYASHGVYVHLAVLDLKGNSDLEEQVKDLLNEK